MPFRKDWSRLQNEIEKFADHYQIPFLMWGEVTERSHISKCIEVGPITQLFKASGEMTETLVVTFLFKTPHEIFTYVFDPTVEAFESALEKFKEHLAPC